MIGARFFRRSMLGITRKSSTVVGRRYIMDAHTVTKKAPLPIFEDVVPTLPEKTLPKKSRNVISTLPPLDTPLIKLEDSTKTISNDLVPDTVTTLLSNGVRVISQQVESLGCVVGVAIEAGPSHERANEYGATLVAERLAFKASSLMEKLEQLSLHGGAIQPFYVKDMLCFMAEVLPEHVELATSIIAEHIRSPEFSEDSFKLAKNGILHQIEEYRNDPAMFMQEMICAVAFRPGSPNEEGGLSRPLLPSQNEINNLTLSNAQSFLSKRYVGPRVIVGGVGIDHDRLDSLATKYFGGLNGDPIGKNAPNSVYQGGIKYMCAASANDQEVDNVVHVSLAFEGAKIDSKDMYVACFLQQLLGGGDSFSTGGPGKGMHSKLYVDALSRYSAFRTAVAFNQCYTDTGLFGIYAAAEGESAATVIQFLLGLLAEVARGIPPVEFSRAKHRLKGALLMNLESRFILFEDLMRQSLSTGRRDSAAVMSAGIEALTPEDVQNFVHKALHSVPSVLVFGPENSLKVQLSVDTLQDIAKQYVAK